MYQHWQMTLPLLLSVYYRYYPVAVPVQGIPVVSQHPDIRTFYCTGTVYFALVVEFVGWDPPLDLWDGIPPDPSGNPQMMGVAQRGRLKFLKMSFWRII